MNAAALLHDLEAAGVSFSVDGADLLLKGNQQAITAHLDEIRQHKPDLIGLLTQAANDTNAEPIPLATASRAEIEAWMDSTGETDTVTRKEILKSYGFDPDFRYPDSGRRTCRQCRNLDADGGCRAARRGQIPNASHHYTWPAGIDDPHRCVGYQEGRP